MPGLTEPDYVQPVHLRALLQHCLEEKAAHTSGGWIFPQGPDVLYCLEWKCVSLICSTLSTFPAYSSLARVIFTDLSKDKNGALHHRRKAAAQPEF